MTLPITILRNHLSRALESKVEQAEPKTYKKKALSANVPLTVHWNGKILEDISGSETVEGIPIIVSGESSDQLLAVLKVRQ